MQPPAPTPERTLEYDTNILHAARSQLREELLIDKPWTEVILVRHAQQSFLDADLAAGGAAGPPLSALGERQAHLAARRLAAQSVSAVYASHLTRAAATAQAIVREAQAPLTVATRADLREVEMHGDVTEDSVAVRTRLTEALTTIAADHPDQTVVAVSHGGAISAFIASLLGVEPSMFFFAAHASITRVRHHGGRWVVQSLNETGHLPAGDLVSH